MCAPCAAAAARMAEMNVGRENIVNNVVPAPGSCSLNKDTLQTWKTIVACLRTSNNLSTAGITVFEANVFAGTIQSALNYPDNYCYFARELENFQSNILPRIVTNVPECIN